MAAVSPEASAGGSTRKSTPESFTDGGLTSIPLFFASLANTASLSVLAMSSVIEAARNSGRKFALR